MNYEEAKTIVESDEYGTYSKIREEAIFFLANHHRNDPCPEHLKKTKTLEYKGFECKIWFNWVPPYNIGIGCLNHWYSTMSGTIDGMLYKTEQPFEENGDFTLEQVLENSEKFLWPIFKKTVDRAIEKHQTTKL